MKFGKEFKTHLEETLPEWRDKFLCYKPLKKLLKNIPSTPSLDPHHQRPVFADATNTAVTPVDRDHQHPPLDLQDWFVRILNEELEKFNDFYVDKEEEFVIRFQVSTPFLPTFFSSLLLGGGVDYMILCYKWINGLLGFSSFFHLN